MQNVKRRTHRYCTRGLAVFVVITVASSACNRTQPAKTTSPARGEVEQARREISIPDSPVSGKLMGTDFRPDDFEVSRDGRLSLRKGRGVFPEAEVTLSLLHDIDKPLAGARWNIPPNRNEFGQKLYVDVHAKKEGETVPTVETYVDDVTLQLSIVETEDDLLEGRIYLALPDDSNSVVSGRFVVEPPTNPSMPPTDRQRPFVTGKVRYQINEKGMLWVGYRGISAKGDATSNSAGLEIEPATSNGFVQSNTFKPRITRLDVLKNQDANYRHTRLEPGVYLFYAKWSDTFVASKWLEIGPQSNIELDFSIHPRVAAGLRVEVGAESKDTEVWLLPLDSRGGLPAAVDDGQAKRLSFALQLHADIVSGAATFRSLRPGTYRVYYGDRTCDARVKQGETFTVTIP